VRPDVGVDAWIDCAGHLPWGQSSDQRHDDAESMTWEWDAGEVTVMGHPRVRLRVSADRPVASVSAKLCDVFPDGTSALVARGSLNLTHRDGHTDPVALEPGQEYDVEVLLDACAHAFAPGQRMRLSLAGADWPNTSCPPEPVTITVHGGELELPEWSGPSPYDAPVLVPGQERSGEYPEQVRWRVERDVLRRTTSCVVGHGSSYGVAHDGSGSESYRGGVSVDRRTFEQRAWSEVTFTLSWPGVDVATTATLDLRASRDHYDVRIDLEATEDGDRVVARRSWARTVPRRLQ
jgi:hypothetical protein